MLIATSKPEDIPSEQAAENQEVEERTQVVANQASAFAKAFGCFMVLIASWAVAVVGVQTRAIQHLNQAVIITYYSVFAFLFTSGMLMIEAIAYGEAIRIFKMSNEQLALGCLVSFVNYLQLACSTISQQNERPGFVTLIGYVGIVYAFLGDFIIFD